MDHPPDGALLFNSANPEDSLPVLSADETYAFSFTGTAANSKADFSIKVQDAAAGAAPWGVRSSDLPSEQNKRKRSDCRNVSGSDQTAARPAREVHGIVLGDTASSLCRLSGKRPPRIGTRKGIRSGLGAGR